MMPHNSSLPHAQRLAEQARKNCQIRKASFNSERLQDETGAIIAQVLGFEPLLFLEVEAVGLAVCETDSDDRAVIAA